MIDYLCSRRTSIWWRPGAGRVSRLSTRTTRDSCDCRNFWKRMDPANFLLQSDSWARDRNIGEFGPPQSLLLFSFAAHQFPLRRSQLVAFKAFARYFTACRIFLIHYTMTLSQIYILLCIIHVTLLKELNYQLKYQFFLVHYFHISKFILRIW